ncbi:MAG: efflux RND transporter permease subunit, partial [Burkholderiales bacterium]
MNLSEWAIEHRAMVLYLIVVCAIAGMYAYTRLGQSEDPPFTFKVMVVRTEWPGASARDVEQQVTDRIERELQELPLEWIRSYSKPGESLVFISLKDSMNTSHVPEYWYLVRKKIGDIRHMLPAGIRGPFFNDEFGDVYTNVYALTGDGFGYRELKDFADHVREELLRVPGVGKVDYIGGQEEKIFVEMSNAKLATLGVVPAQIFQTLAEQNAVTAAGVFETSTDRIYLRPTGVFDSVEAIRNLTIHANGREFRLGDVTTVTRGYADPPAQKMRFNGREALGIGVTLVKGGDVIDLG